jgi:hypothetical protein
MGGQHGKRSEDSWAFAAEGIAHQWGSRRLCDEVIDAATWWEAVGRPGIFDFGLTVTGDGQSAHQLPGQPNGVPLLPPPGRP